jgi:hypothetical protein
VAAREDAALRKNDRKTQLAEFLGVAMKFQPLCFTQVTSIQHKLAKHRRFHVNWLGITPLNAKFGDGDLICRCALRVNIDNHSLHHQIIYTIIAYAMECVIYREILLEQPEQRLPSKTLIPSCVVLRYQGDTEPDVRIILSDIESSIASSIAAISKQIQSGY